MPFTLNEIVPWGRSFEEYLRFFSLSEADLKKPILGCADGPASFNAVLTTRGGSVVSADPLYRFSAAEIRGRIDETFGAVMDGLRDNMDEFVWTDIPSVEALGERRMRAMEVFLKDFPKGLEEGRYLNACLPTLPFKRCRIRDCPLLAPSLPLRRASLRRLSRLFNKGTVPRGAGRSGYFPSLNSAPKLPDILFR